MRLLFLALVAFFPVALGGQSPGRAIGAALQAMTSGGGGCDDMSSVQPFQLPYFPAVQFYRGHCVREHGDSTTAVVALDADSVLYMLGSLEALRFLEARHPPRALDSAGAVAYVHAALELTGQATGYARLVRSPGELPAGLRDSTRERAGWPLSYARPTDSGRRWWTVVLTQVDPPGYYRPSLLRYEAAVLLPAGSFQGASARVLWHDTKHP
jgi:hypothetical protein